jgi:hypothetical protein
MRGVGRLAALVMLLAAAPAAYQQTVDLQSINEALGIGQSRVESVRTRFHERYRFTVAKPPVDYVEVVTPFRRVVLAAEERYRLGDRRFGQREALATLAEHADAVELFVELTFHPLNNYLAVPPYDVRVAEPGVTRDVPVRRLDRVPRYGPRMDGYPLPYPFPASPPPPAGSQPLLGGTIVA